MILQGLFFCVIFLTLFGLALWPVLFKNSKHFKLVLIAANAVFLFILICFGSAAGSTQKKWQEKREAFRQETLPAAAALLEGDRPVTCTTVPENEMDIEVIDGLLQQFNSEVRTK